MLLWKELSTGPIAYTRIAYPLTHICFYSFEKSYERKALMLKLLFSYLRDITVRSYRCPGYLRFKGLRGGTDQISIIISYSRSN